MAICQKHGEEHQEARQRVQSLEPGVMSAVGCQEWLEGPPNVLLTFWGESPLLSCRFLASHLWSPVPHTRGSPEGPSQPVRVCCQGSPEGDLLSLMLTSYDACSSVPDVGVM